MPPISRRGFSSTLSCAVGAALAPHPPSTSPTRNAARTVIDLSSNENPYGPATSNPQEETDMKAIAYTERIIEALAPLSLRPMTTYRGEDITRFERIETDMMTHTMRCFEADKLDKIVTIHADVMGGKIVVWGTTIVPSDEYPLPLFTSEVVQAVNHLSLRVDLIPLADCGRDMAYLEKYMAPMEPLWEKYKDIEGMGTERYLWHRVMLSPFYTCGKIKYDVPNIEETSLGERESGH